MKNTYWDNYYGTRAIESPPEVPSQFAAFVASELNPAQHCILDIGCGNGRDTRFFSRCGFRSIGIDRSSSAIEHCAASDYDKSHTSFLCEDLSSDTWVEGVRKFGIGLSMVVYARFFLHAIDDDSEKDFFKIAKALCGADGMIAAEFRTEKDSQLPKTTKPHYRRYIRPQDLVVRASEHGFAIQYFAEGFGFAKFRSDDAHVARVLFSSDQSVPL